MSPLRTSISLAITGPSLVQPLLAQCTGSLASPPLLVVPQLTEILHYRTSKITSPFPSSLKTDLLVF